MQTQSITKKIGKLRRLMIEALEPNESHHIGCAFSILDIVAVLYYDILTVDSKNPDDPDRDIFILSKGHAALAVYAVLCEKGFFSKNVLMTYDRNGGILPEHITYKAPGVEVSTGSLGHGLPISIGFSIARKNDNKKNMIYVIMSDGELNEGSNWEAIQFAAHHKLSNIVAIIDQNGYQGYAATKDVIDLSPIADKFSAFKWNVYSVDGHDVKKLQDTFSSIQKNKSKQPTVVIARTHKGHEIPFFENEFESHYRSINAETKELLLKILKE